MKQNFAFTICYFIYFGIAIFIHPAKSYQSFTSDVYIRSIQKQEVPIASERTDILHGELLFKF